MAATAAYLSTDVQTNEDNTVLKALTNRSTPTATTIDTTVLLDVCGQAISRFQREVTTYDPDNYGEHLYIARSFVMIILHQKTANGQKKAAEIYEAIRPSIDQFRKKRTLAPITDSTWEPTARESSKPPFDDTFFTPFKAR